MPPRPPTNPLGRSRTGTGSANSMKGTTYTGKYNYKGYYYYLKYYYYYYYYYYYIEIIFILMIFTFSLI